MPNFTHLYETGNSLMLVNGDIRMFAYPTSSQLWLVESAEGPIADTFVWPFDPDDINSEWGYRTPPVSGVSDFHSGCDWAASSGAEIKAAGDGVAHLVRDKYTLGMPGGRSWGNRIAIDHGLVGGDRLFTAYAHMQDNLFPVVDDGDPVTVGQVIGYVGRTGSATGTHLHFSTFIGGLAIGTNEHPRNCVNPRSFMATYNPLGNIA